MIAHVRKSRFLWGLCIVFFLAVPVITIAEEGDVAFVGAARIDITPETPVQMYGYSARTTESAGIAGRLHASALAIGADTEPGPCVLLAVDNGSVPSSIRDEVFRRINEKQTIPSGRFVLCNSHNHSGPNLKGMEAIEGEDHEHLEAYAELLTARLTSVVLEALAARQPANLAWAQGTVEFAANRRVLTDGRWTGFGAVPEGVVDHSLPVLRVTDVDGELIALAVNYACHNTTLRGNFREIHGDWAGCAQAALLEACPDAVPLITIGCGSDSDPCPHSTTELCEQHGQAVADEVSRLLDEGGWVPLTGSLSAQQRFLKLPYSERSEEGTETIVTPLTGGGGPPREDLDFETFQITTWAFSDDLAMVFFSDEVVVDYSLRLKSEFDADRLWVSAYTNDVSRYIVSSRLIGEGGYEVRNSLSAQLTFDNPATFSPPMEDRVADAVHEMLSDEFER